MSDQTGQPAQDQPAERPAPAPEQTATWGAPAQERQAPRWSWKKTAAATAVAVGVATAGGFAVYAAGSASADGAGRERGPGGMVFNGGPGGVGGQRALGGLMGALHGEFTAPDGNGGYHTLLLQTGEVTAISDTSITAKSADGYTKTYAIDSETVKTAVEQGVEVTIIATPSGDTATADSISRRGDQMRGGPGAGGQQPGVLPRRDGSQPGGAEGQDGPGAPPTT